VNQNGKVDYSLLPAPITESEDPDSQRPFTSLEKMVADVWNEVIGTQALGLRANFFEIGGDSIKAAIIVNRIQQQLNRIIHVVTIFDAPTIEQYAAYLQQHYSDALGAWQENAEGHTSNSDQFARVTASDFDELRRIIEQQPGRRTARPVAQKNPPVLFILSGPRSGSTLLRVMLGGHSRMVAPPELELLSYNDLRQRREAFSGRESFWQQGTVRALMQLRSCDREEAEREMARYEADGMTTQGFYRVMQEAAGDALLVDKTPFYAFDMETLRRAEDEFEGALYIHLVRNPYGMIRSYEEAHVDQIFPRFSTSFPTRKLGEVIWTVCEQNIHSFLESVPAERQQRVNFEHLVQEPERVMREVSNWLGFEYEPGMIDPYLEKQKRMTDGVHEVSKPLGDIKFLDHIGIEGHRAESWRSHYHEEFLSEETWKVAERLGYNRSYWGISSDALTLSPIVSATGNGEIEKTIAEIPHLSDDEVQKMLASLV
jgi:hypothetical protein